MVPKKNKTTKKKKKKNETKTRFINELNKLYVSVNVIFYCNTCHIEYQCI